MNTSRNIAGALLAGLIPLAAWAQGGGDAAEIRHGRYLIQTSGCNDCHTPGYTQKDGQVAETEWLTGDAMGWHGPWGTPYPAKLRQLVQQMDEKAWLARARQPMRPPRCGPCATPTQGELSLCAQPRRQG